MPLFTLLCAKCCLALVLDASSYVLGTLVFFLLFFLNASSLLRVGQAWGREGWAGMENPYGFFSLHVVTP